MKKITSMILTLVLAVGMCLGFTACGSSEESAGKAETLVMLDINPSIELTIDENEKVVSVYGANEDGQVLLYQQTGIVGADIEKAVQKITDLAIELGYVSSDNKVINTSVVSSDEKKADKIENKINAKITARGQDFGFDLKINEQQAFSLMRKYEEFVTANPEYADTLSVKKFSLALSATDKDETLTLEVAVTLDEGKLIEIISKGHAKLEEFATDAYRRAKKEAERIYDKAVESALSTVYEMYYLQNLSAHPVTGAYYGKMYSAFKTGEIVFDSLGDTIELLHEVENITLDETTVNEVLALFGDAVTVEQITNRDGNVTVESIEHFADIYFKNAQEEMERVEEALEDFLDDLEDTLEEKIDLTKYEAEINAVKEQLTAVKNAFASVGVIIDIPELAVLDEIIGQIISSSENGFTEDEIEDIEEAFEDASEDMLEKINADLTAEEKAEVENMKGELLKSCEQFKTAFKNALNEAEVKAKDRINDLREQRKNKDNQ